MDYINGIFALFVAVFSGGVTYGILQSNIKQLKDDYKEIKKDIKSLLIDKDNLKMKTQGLVSDIVGLKHQQEMERKKVQSLESVTQAINITLAKLSVTLMAIDKKLS